MTTPKNRPKEKDLNIDRIVFFSDAVVAIAITLLVLDLKLDVPLSQPVQWSNIVGLWPKFAAFFLSFYLIASFWIVHNQFFRYIKRVNEKLVWLNVAWLFFIAILPFSASLLSAHFGESVATLVYAINTLGITACQNFIWDYACVQLDFIDETMPPADVRNYRIYFNIGMINGLIAIVLAFFTPVISFFILFTRTLMVGIYMLLTSRRYSN